MFFTSFLYAAMIISICMVLLFLLAIWIKDNSIVDIFWGTGFIIIAATTLLLTPEVTIKKIIVSLAILIWGIRLSLHIFLRNKGRGEDFRYQNWRATWKSFYLQSFFRIFLLQGSLMLILASPVVLINSSPSDDPGFLELCGIFIFLSGFFMEVIADEQLRRFRQKPENNGQIIQSGLWKFSRHPNYFGESIVWWGIWLAALPEVNGLFTIISPLAITFLLRYVSGVPMLEKKYEGRPDWEAYKKLTPPFIPRIRI